MKKLFALVLGLALILTASFALAEDYTIYLVTMDQMDQHWVSVDQGCKDAVAEFAAKGININYKWNAPTNGKDDAAQIEIINNAYADNADAILLASNGPDTQVATIEELAADGVAFVYVDSPANSDVALQTICTDNTAAGKMAGETLLAALTAAGVTEGKVGIVNVNAATTSTVHREAGFRAAFEGTKFEIMETQYGEGDPSKSQEIATNFITDGAVALFGTNEGGTVGVGNAIAAEGETKVLGVGFDKSDAILNLVKTGALVATTAQNPYNMGYYGIQTAVAFLVDGTTEFEDIDSGAVILDAAAIG